MKTLHLTLKKKWFDMIASGEKKEEYREVKPYWEKRLANVVVKIGGEDIEFKRWWDVVQFKNGYGKYSPIIKYKWHRIEIREGKPEWGAEPGKKYFVIKLGERL